MAPRRRAVKAQCLISARDHAAGRQAARRWQRMAQQHDTTNAAGDTTTRHNVGNGRHNDGEGQQGDRRYDDSDGWHNDGDERHDHGGRQQGDRQHDVGDGRPIHKGGAAG